MIKQITEITLENFQSHKQTTVKLSNGVNVLSGESNNGKTAIPRAMVWLLTNRPSGIGFVSNWAKETNSKGDQVIKKNEKCEVSLSVITTDGATHIISRVRTKDDNYYMVDGVKLEAVGTNVPEQVTSMLGMKDINIQSQDDGYFFLTLTPGQAAARLNELVHLDDIDRAYEWINKKKRACSAIIKEWTEVAADIKQNINHLPDIVELTSLVEQLSEIDTQITELTDKAWDLQDAMEGLLDLNSKLKKLPSVDCASDIARLEDLIEDLQEVQKSKEALQEIHSKIVQINKAYNELSTVTEEEINELVELVNKRTEANEKYIDLNNMKNNIEIAQEDLYYNKDRLKEVEANLPETCPTCGQVLNKEQL